MRYAMRRPLLAQQSDDLHPEIFPRPRINSDRAGILAAMHRDAVRERRQTEDRVGHFRFDAARNRVDDQRVGVERQMEGVLLGVAGGDEGDAIAADAHPSPAMRADALQADCVRGCLITLTFVKPSSSMLATSESITRLNNLRSTANALPSKPNGTLGNTQIRSGCRDRSGLALDALDQIGVRHLAQRNHDRNIARQGIDFRKGEIFVANDVASSSPLQNSVGASLPSPLRMRHTLAVTSNKCQSDRVLRAASAVLRRWAARSF